MMPGTSLGALFRQIRAALDAGAKPDAALDARLIVEHATGTSRLDLISNPDRIVSHEQSATALALLDRRLAGEPIHRILGFRDFYGMTLTLSRETLEPRPDTEALVDLVLPVVHVAAERNGVCRVLDLGTGTGAVALALLSQEQRARAVATDISLDALATATRNADMTGNAHRFETLLSDWFDAVTGTFDVIVSNPPYIATQVIAGLDWEVREHDPLAALDGGADGLAAYRAIAVGAVAHLERGGLVAVEIGFDQASSVRQLFEAAGFRQEAEAKDLGDHVRALAFRVMDS